MIVARLTDDTTLSLVSSGDEEWKLLDFALSVDSLSFQDLPDSCYSTPARYLHEILRRVIELNLRQSTLIVNPLIDLDRLNLLQLIRLVRNSRSLPRFCVFADVANRPLAYLFAPNCESVFAISLLSTVDADIDASLLARIYGCEVQRVPTNLSSTYSRHIRIHSVPVKTVYRWIANQALDTMGTGVGEKPFPWAAIMPYHAGDALFLSLAAETTLSPVSHVVVCKDYAAVYKNHAPFLNLIEIDLSPPYRNGWKISEEDYFEFLRPKLPKGFLYLYLRPSGDYNRTYWHLIDHFAFALGASPRRQADLLWDMPRHSVESATTRPPPFRVLLHFDAGWPLKIYPPEHQKELIQLLRDDGHAVTVLGKADANTDGCKAVKFSDYDQLRELILGHDVIVGMDSFPVHLATHGLGIPSICLFSSTRPENSNAPRSSHYTFLERGLTCRPCIALEKCPVHGGPYCLNFALPRAVHGAITRLLGDPRTQEYKSAQSESSANSVTECSNSTVEGFPVSIMRVQRSAGYRQYRARPRVIELRYLDAAITRERLDPRNYVGPVAGLLHQFIHSSRQQGVLRTITKTFRFISRNLSKKGTRIQHTE